MMEVKAWLFINLLSNTNHREYHEVLQIRVCTIVIVCVNVEI